MVESTEFDRLEFYEVNKDRWPDFVRLHETCSGPKSCWSMVWRAFGEE
jgi:hypothetical protein